MEERLTVLLQALQCYHPQRVILFGSTARGDTDAASDVDVLVVKDTEESFVHRLETMAALWAVTAVQAIVSLVTQKVQPSQDA